MQPPAEDEPGGQAYVIEADVFGDLHSVGPHPMQAEAVAVLATPGDSAVSALVATARRWMYVGKDGTMFDSDEELLRAPWYQETPSWVSDVLQVEAELVLVLDASGVVPAAMRRRLLLVLREELAGAGVVQAHIRRPTGDLRTAPAIAKTLD